MFKFYLPFYYLFYSRLKTKIDMISWAIIWIVPQFFIVYNFTDINLGILILVFLLSQTIFNTLYEIGYIENDISTTKNEKKPTLRLDTKSSNYIANNYFKIIYFRYFLVTSLLGLLFLLNNYFKLSLNIEYFIALLVVTRLFFYWHNSVRSRINLLTFSMLAVTKYLFPIILLIKEEELLFVSLVSITFFAILRIIEHSTHKRYNLFAYAKFIGNHDRFRIFYYLFFLLFFTTLYFLNILLFSDFKLIAILLVYFLLYRVFSYLLLEKGLYVRDEIKNKDLYMKDVK